MTSPPTEKPPALSMTTLVGDLAAVPAEDAALVRDVIEVLDWAEQQARDHWWAPGMAATLRIVLLPHRRAPDGSCAACRQPPWPCPLWHTAHRWMIDLDATNGSPYE